MGTRPFAGVGLRPFLPSCGEYGVPAGCDRGSQQCRMGPCVWRVTCEECCNGNSGGVENNIYNMTIQSWIQASAKVVFFIIKFIEQGRKSPIKLI